MDLKPKAFKLQRWPEKKVNILKTTMKTHHEMYRIVNVIKLIYDIRNVTINERIGSFYNSI